MIQCCNITFWISTPCKLERKFTDQSTKGCINGGAVIHDFTVTALPKRITFVVDTFYSKGPFIKEVINYFHIDRKNFSENLKGELSVIISETTFDEILGFL